MMSVDLSHMIDEAQTFRIHARLPQHELPISCLDSGYLADLVPLHVPRVSGAFEIFLSLHAPALLPPRLSVSHPRAPYSSPAGPV